jgi:glycerol kinase
METLLIIDAGTTSIRSVLFTTQGAMCTSFHKQNPPIFHQDGRVEQEAASYSTILEDLLKQTAYYAQQHNLQIRGIAITAFRSAVVPLDSQGTPLSQVIMWQDTRTDSQCAQYLSQHDDIYQRTGSSVSSIFSALKIAWLRDHMPEVYAQTYKMVGIQDLMLHYLTGNFVTDQSCAGRSSLMNIHTRTWDPELLRIFKLDQRLLCDLVQPGTLVGTLLGHVADRTGLCEGLPVITAGGDQQCAALGSGLLSESEVIANTGTGSYVMGLSQKPILDPKRRVFCTPSAIAGAYHLEAGMISTGTVYRWFNEVINNSEVSQKIDFKTLDREAGESKAGANGLLVIPHFKGSGSPYWNPNATGIIQNISLSTTRGDIARAILEGIAIEIAQNIELFEELSQKVESVRVSGGMAKSAVFNQIQADILGKEVVQPFNCESTALGAWMNAAVTLGIFNSHAEAYSMAAAQGKSTLFKPNKALAPVYADLYERKKMVYKALSH